jgi:DNA adenine methylase
MKPILRWLGGKQRQLKHIRPHIPKDFEWYHEPFFGGGAVFFDLMPKHATINDQFRLLMAFYSQLPKHLCAVINLLDTLSTQQAKEDYLRIRSEAIFPTDTWELSPALVAKFYYMNKLSYNSMMRFKLVESRSGAAYRYNVPYGKPLKNLYNKNHLMAAGSILDNTEIWSCDYQEYFKKLIDIGDLIGHVIYVDPPYCDTHAEYSTEFDMDDAKMLQKWCNAMHAFGATVIVSLSAAMASSWDGWDKHDVGVKYTADRRRRPLSASQAILVKRG